MARIYLERREMNDDLRHLVDLLEADMQASGIAGEVAPPFDVIEVGNAVEIVMDLPGVDRDSLQVDDLPKAGNGKGRMGFIQ